MVLFAGSLSVSGMYCGAGVVSVGASGIVVGKCRSPASLGMTTLFKFYAWAMNITIRLAEARDIPALRELIAASVRGLQVGDYSAAQLEAALSSVYGVDTQLISDGSYFAAEVGGKETESPLRVGCGGWSRRKTLYGGDGWKNRALADEDSLLDPKKDAAKIRAFFVHPDWARRGIGGMILEACEKAAWAAGFRRLEMGATLTGVPFYRAKGYVELAGVEVPLGEGLTLPIVRMVKNR